LLVKFQDTVNLQYGLVWNKKVSARLFLQVCKMLPVWPYFRWSLLYDVHEFFSRCICCWRGKWWRTCRKVSVICLISYVHCRHLRYLTWPMRHYFFISRNQFIHKNMRNVN